MIKNELKKLRRLSATPKMMRLAAEDIPHRNGWHDEIYTRALYMRCLVQNGILKVAFYLPENMRTGGRAPSFELYISRESKQFLTYDRLHDKWLTGKLDRLPWPRYVGGQEKRWISKAGHNLIKNYLGGQHGGYTGLLEYQLQIRADELKRRHKRETDPWDLDLAQVPDVPKDWKRWVDKVGITQNYIFYHYLKKGATSGYCTFCGKEVPIRKPRYNKEGRCPCCRHKITFKSVGKAGMVVTEQECMYLIQRCEDGFVVREFVGYRKYPKGEYQSPDCVSWEIRRVIYNKAGLNPRAYYWGDYKHCEMRWMPSSPCSYTWRGNEAGKVYGKTLPHLAKKELRPTGLIEMLPKSRVMDPEKYLAIYQQIPQLEKIIKADLPQFLQDCMTHCSNVQPRIINGKASSLTKILGIDSQELRRLRQNFGGWRFLEWLQYEKASSKEIADDVIHWFCSKGITVQNVNFILDRMNPLQIRNYLQRQARESRKDVRTVLGTWEDYLSMAKRLKMDTNDEIVFRVRKLRKRHDELVRRCQEKELSLQAEEILEKYPHVNQICQSLKAKYEYSNEEYAVLAPSCIEDIIWEGRKLSHCVASSERYWERIERQEAYVLFLRRVSELDKPYYTLEIEPDGTVRQKRTEYDRQKPDIEKAKEFLKEWQRTVAQRLTEADRKLAQKSSVLREQEFVQLRNDQVIIHTGDLAGQLLVDVLLADLMENPAGQEDASLPAEIAAAA